MKYLVSIIFVALNFGFLLAQENKNQELKQRAQTDAEMDLYMNRNIDFPKTMTYNGKKYESIKIGEQIWLTENLSTSNFNNGDKIPFASNREEWKKAYTEEKPAWCYYNFDSNYDYLGKFYNGYVILDERGIAPEGWRVPTIDDWLSLVKYLEKSYGKNSYVYDMKSSSGWEKYTLNNGYEQIDGTNKSGFNAKPSSLINREEKMRELGYGLWWSSSYDFESAPGSMYGMVLEVLPFKDRIWVRENMFFGTNFFIGDGLNIRLIKE